MFKKLIYYEKKEYYLVFVLLILYSILYHFKTELIEHDATLWINYGLQLFSGNLSNFIFDGGKPAYSPLIFTPGYPFFIGLVNLVINNSVHSAYFVSILSGISLCYILFKITSELVGKNLGYITFIIAATSPFLVYFAVSTYVRSIAMLFFTLSIYYYLRLINTNDSKFAYLAGVAIAISILVRFEFVIYAIIFEFVLIFEHAINKKILLKNIIKLSLSIILVYSLYAIPLYFNSGYIAISPYIGNGIVYQSPPVKVVNPNQERYDKLNLVMRTVLFNQNTASSINLVRQNKVSISEKDSIKYINKKSTKTVFLTRLYKNYRKVLGKITPNLVGIYLFPFFILGIYFMEKNKINVRLILYLLIIVTLILFPLKTARVVRYYGQIVPIFIIISSFGIYYLIEKFKKYKYISFIPILIFAVLLAVNIFKDISGLKTEYTAKEKMWLKTAEILKKNSIRSEDIVLARKNYPAFYSGARMAWLPDEQNLDDVWSYANFIGADYLVIEDQYATKLMPQYKILLTNNGAKAYSNLDLINSTSTDEYNFKIYKFIN